MINYNIIIDSISNLFTWVCKVLFQPLQILLSLKDWKQEYMEQRVEVRLRLEDYVFASEITTFFFNYIIY